jgi:tripartite-type tricarboxylate transporter receptor subunit TctC
MTKISYAEYRCVLNCLHAAAPGKRLMNRRRWLIRGLLLAVLPLMPAYAVAYPDKPVRLIAGARGTPGDVVARVLSERLSAGLGQRVVVDNRPGAINTIALAHVVKAEPDGHTLGVMGMPSTVAPALIARIPYDTARDFAPVRQISWVTHVLVVRARSPVTSVPALVAAAKARPGGLTFASGGNGTPAHLSGELFRRSASIPIRHVPYKGALEGVTAVMGEEVDMMFATTPAVAGHIASGRLRALATPAPSRLAAFPEVPTLRELGYPEIEMRDWHGIVAPRHTPPAILSRLGDEIAAAVSHNEVQEQLAALGASPAMDSTPARFGALIRSDLARWAKVVREAGIQAD